MHSIPYLKRNYIELELATQKPRFTGRYRMLKRHTESGIILQDTGWFDNLITDAGLNRIGTGAANGFCVIGTGTAAPAFGDTSLQAKVAQTNTPAPGAAGFGNLGAPDYISTYEMGYRFSAGQLNGNYSEIGISWDGTYCWSRALILDGLGNPTTISVASTEFLDVFYQVRLIPDLADYAGTVVISGVTYSTVRRPSNVSNTSSWGPRINTAQQWTGYSSAGGGASNGSLGSVTGSPGGSYGGWSSYSNATYVNNSLERGGSISWSLDSGNVSGGITAIINYGTYAQYQTSFSPAIPKDSTKTLLVNGKVSWGRL